MATTGRGTVAGGKNSVSSQLIETAVDLMALYNRSGKLNDPRILSDLCVSIARGIDHAIANNEVPLKLRCLPQLLPKIDIWKHEISALIPFMMLMMSIKIACKIGWFQQKESDDLLSLASEVQRFFSTDDVLDEPCDALPLVSIIMSRFYPNLKIEDTLGSIEVKPGYRTTVVEFNISRGVVDPERETIGIIVARVDDMDASSCIITPQEVNIMLNGVGVLGRNNTSMEGVPQLPTNVTAMLKYGVNLLQAIGKFDGRYIIVVAIMSAIPSSDTLQLQDYVQPAVASGDPDTEMASRTSLNCPIRKSRMRTPVKGHHCKHPQCFDYDNYVEINSRRPFWRCPLCDQPLCCSDMRIDRNVVKVLREAGENIVHVIISKDGYWKAVPENYDSSSRPSGNTPSFHNGLGEVDPLRTILCEDQNNLQDGCQNFHDTNNIGTSGVNNMHHNTSNSSSFATKSTKVIDQGNKADRLLAQNSHGYVLPSANQNGCCPNTQTLNKYHNLKKSSIITRDAIHGQRLQFQKDGGIQASHTTQNIQSSILVPHTEQLRTGDKKKENMQEKTNLLSRKDGLVELPSEDWRPSGRMRGSLQGQAYSEAYNRIIGQPTQPVRASEPPSRLVATFSIASQMPGIKSKSPYVHAFRQPNAQTSIGNATNLQGSADCLSKQK